MPTDLGAYMQSLYSRFGELPGVMIELHRELPAVRIDNDRASATVFLQGAQLSHYQPHGEPPVIWCSPDCDYRSGTPLRGGIPVCWPWFGQAERNPEPIRALAGPDAPAHGLVRDRDWQLDSIHLPHSGQTELHFSLELAQDQEPAWPAATRLTLTIAVGDSLDVRLDVENRSDRPVVFSGALHSYFAVSSIDRVAVNGLDGLAYIDCLQDWSQQRQQGELIIDRETDRIYHDISGPVVLADRGWRRALEVRGEGSRSAVIWNPWADKARRLSQFPDTAYRDMLCIETANADRDIVELAPSQHHRLGVTVRSQSLN